MTSDRAEVTTSDRYPTLTRRTALHVLGLGAGAAWFARSGADAGAAIPRSQSADGDTAPYVVTQRFQAPSEPLLTQLMNSIESSLLPAMSEEAGFLDLLLFDSAPDELTIVSIHGDKRGAERAFAFAGEWIAKDDAGTFLEYTAHRGFGERLRYFKTESVTAPTPTPVPGIVVVTPGSYAAQDGSCGYCLQRWPTEPGIIERAVVAEIASQLDESR